MPGSARSHRSVRTGFPTRSRACRVVERIENDGAGLNLTWEVRNGIGCHSYSNPSPEGRARTLEGRAVYFADKIAYLNHDLEDALRAKVLTQDDIPWTIKYALGRTKSQRITALITSLVENSGEDVGMDKATAEAFAQFNSFMYEAVYLNPVAKGEEGKAEEVVQEPLPPLRGAPAGAADEYQAIYEREDAARAACDYISGMSDRYAVATYERLFVPAPMGNLLIGTIRKGGGRR